MSEKRDKAVQQLLDIWNRHHPENALSLSDTPETGFQPPATPSSTRELELPTAPARGP